MTEHRDSLVGRAVEAAARAEHERGWPITGTWVNVPEPGREKCRVKVRPHVLAALGVVADHCYAVADASQEALDSGGWGDRERIGTLRDLAAELRETPE